MSDFGYGQMTPTDTATEFSSIAFMIKQFINKISTVMPVKVMAVSAQSGSSIGTVDVQPLVSLLDGVGNASQHGIVRGITYFRLQGGSSAIIIDPVVGDIGYITCASHDISSVKATQGAANPGSRRRYSLSDGIYCGGILNGDPKQYIQFNSAGVTITDITGNQIIMNSQGITLQAVNVTITGNLQLGGSFGGLNNVMYPSSIVVGGALEAVGGIIAGVGTSDQVNLQTHTHSGVTTGGGISGAPVPGT